jgi:phytoene dehydrogenase-like protein
MNRKVKIIGAGIAGLSAGCYLQMNGYESEIFEMHNMPGGLCTAWERQGYRFDGCLHWLVGSSPDDGFYYLWNELVNIKNFRFIYGEEYFRIEDKQGNYISLFNDADRLQNELLEKAPEDKKLIIELVNDIKKFARLDIPVDKAPETMGLFHLFKMIIKIAPYFNKMRKWNRYDFRKYSEKYKNPLLRKAIEWAFIPEMSVFFFIYTMAGMHRKSSGYPVGGSLNLSLQIEKRYLELGGKIHYNSKVVKIETQETSTVATVTGITTAKGEFHGADIVISAADGHFTIFKMLEGKYTDSKINNIYNTYLPFPSYFQVSLGVARKFDNEPSNLIFPVDEPIRIDEHSVWDLLEIRIFNFDPTMAPEGKTVITAIIGTPNYQYWDEMKKNNPQHYKAEKERIANEVIDAIEKRIGNVKQFIEVTDVATPATVIRYTNNWKGSFEGWVLTPDIGLKQISKTLPGLKNFYMAGQWVEPGGGLPAVLMSGRNVAQIICKKDKKKFITLSF